MTQGQVEQLFKTIGEANRMLILPHNDPDPDAIASAVALRYLLEKVRGIEGRIGYKGIIGRAENKALVRYLNVPFQPLTELNLAEGGPIALIDTQPAAGNNPLPAEAAVAIVIDHHPWREATARASFADVRSEIGATSTMLTEYLLAFGLEPETRLATALFYGLKTDTRGLSRNASPADVKAYFYLQARLEVKALAEIEYAQVPVDYFKSFHLSLHTARNYEGVIIAYLGQMNYPDLAAETADFLLRLEGSQWVICSGIYEQVLFFSVRTRNQQGGAGRLAQAIVGKEGAAGGHGTMAGGQTPLNGRKSAQVAQRLGHHALEYLKVGPGVVGRPLI